MKALVDAWQSRSWLAYSLLPIAWVYGALICVRRLAYQLGWLTTHKLPCPVIVVGNVVAGGAGKTPTVIALTQHLQAHGYRVGIISRGFGRRSQACMEVRPDSKAEEVGDEPLLIHRKSQAPCFVAASRWQAGQDLLKAYPEVNLIIADDGLQHLALHRDLEIIVFDARGVGNGWLLPAGPLREPWRSIPVSPEDTDIEGESAGMQCKAQTTAIPSGIARICNAAVRPTDQSQVGIFRWNGYINHSKAIILQTESCSSVNNMTFNFFAQRTLSQWAINAHHEKRLLVEIVKTAPQPIIALAGIARPQAFFEMLKAQNLVCHAMVELPDHAELSRYEALLNQHPDATWICTEKDAVKFWQLKPSVWAVSLELVLPEAFFDQLDRTIAKT